MISVRRGVHSETVGKSRLIDTWCPEVETYPRAFAAGRRRASNEAFVNLALGMNTVSLLIMDTRYETDAWYGECLLRRLRRNGLSRAIANTTKVFPWG